MFSKFYRLEAALRNLAVAGMEPGEVTKWMRDNLPEWTTQRAKVEEAYKVVSEKYKSIKGLPLFEYEWNLTTQYNQLCADTVALVEQLELSNPGDARQFTRSLEALGKNPGYAYATLAQIMDELSELGKDVSELKERYNNLYPSDKPNNNDD